MVDTHYGEKCVECGKPIGTQHQGEKLTTGENRGKWRHVPPCPETARPAWPNATATSTGGMPHKGHEDRNTKIPPKRPR